MEATYNSNSRNNKLNNHKFPESDRSYCRNYALYWCVPKRGVKASNTKIHK